MKDEPTSSGFEEDPATRILKAAGVYWHGSYPPVRSESAHKKA